MIAQKQSRQIVWIAPRYVTDYCSTIATIIREDFGIAGHWYMRPHDEAISASELSNLFDVIRCVRSQELHPYAVLIKWNDADRAIVDHMRTLHVPTLVVDLTVTGNDAFRKTLIEILTHISKP